MDRTYLFVPPEEKAEVEALGAHWDTALKCWYIIAGETSEKFSKWLSPFEEDEDLTIVSSEAFVAATTVRCHRCDTNIEVICIHCASGTVSDEPLSEFSVSYIWAMDEELTQQLKPWPFFRRTRASGNDPGDFANHCPHCGEVQDDLFLHSEPDHPFFDIPHAPADSIKLTRLDGTFRFCGSEHFSIE
jgi:hypothetical protein